eukprot:8828413-Ditylum_brightwellii.AAC.1
MAAYTHQPNLLTQDHIPFQKQIQEWEQQRINAMTLWLKQHIPYIQHCLHVAKIHKAMKHLDIRLNITGSLQAVQNKTRHKNQRRKHPKVKAFSCLQQSKGYVLHPRNA